ncbi:MAG: lactate permease LctP family transporter [Helicobacter trogontum]|uniref:L-lactate permease n=1 Tax=Helicobacter trogontum TaxID=50960 RepID=A0A4U8TDU9_9HELI|nr:lactate permease LctP family transporter [Helicobacter trogontum]MCI5786872.1 lactate permease LctP family transporter [Helicobacter trogontum]MDY5185403.1 lactate permease LctP family transporter [Helicobacter trogontum]TLD98053.1 L-lactate permease [Helicobacter trogontum]
MNEVTQATQWTQNYMPVADNIWLSGLVALLPILLFLACLVWFKLKGWLAASLTVGFSAIIALVVYGMPFNMVAMSFIQGFLVGLWPIAWIIIAAIFLYKIAVKTGYFEILKESVIAVTPDQRLQVILIAFCFGAFLEGAIGFGGPVAITAALLVGLGLRPLYAAGLCMIANTAPVAFGAVGIPVIALAKAVGLDAGDIAAMVGRMLPPLTLFVPFFIVFLMSGFKGVKETFPAVFVAAVTFAGVQYWSSNHLGPELPDIISAIAAIATTSIFLKFWQPANIERADDTKTAIVTKQYPLPKIILAWMPFILLVITIGIWQMPFFMDLFKPGNILANTNIVWLIPGLDKLVIQQSPIVAVPTALGADWKWYIIQNPGTAIFLAALLSIVVLRANAKQVMESASETIKEMSIPVLTIGLVLAFAFISKNSGQAATMGLALAHTGSLFPFFSPFIGWVGVFLTGSDTSSNLLFGPLQQVTAKALNMPEVLFMAANTVGGVVGKMISPQSIAIACAAVGLVGRESELFRFTLKYSIGFVVFVGIWTAIIAYVIPGIIVN